MFLKRIAKLLVFVMLFQMVPEVAWAASGNVTRMVTKAFHPKNTVSSVEELFPRDWVAAVLVVAAMKEQQAQQPAPAPTGVEVPPQEWPTFGDGFKWEKPGVAPMIPMSLIPGFGQGDLAKDMEIIQGIVLGEQGYEVPTRLFWAYISMSLFNGQKPDKFFVEDLKAVVQRREFFPLMLAPTTVFRTRMGWGYHDNTGVPQVKLSGIPYIVFNESIGAYQFGTVVPKSGLYKGLPLSLVVPQICFNGVFVEGVPVEATLPKEPVVVPDTQTAEVVVKKEWRSYKGKKMDAPDRDEIAVRFEATPITGGDKVVAEAYDNKEAKLHLEVGREYTLREVIDSMDWRADRENVTFRVGEKNKPIKITNTEVVEKPETTAAQLLGGPMGPQGPKGKDGKGMSKWIWLPIGAAGALGLVALLLKGGPNINADECKPYCSSPNPGGRP